MKQKIININTYPEMNEKIIIILSMSNEVISYMLTDNQREFATENHNLIYSFLIRMDLQIDDWYDIVALGFLNAISAFDDKKAKFSTYAYKCMLNAVRKEKRNNMTKNKQTLIFSINETCKYNEKELDYENIIPDKRNYHQQSEFDIDFERYISEKLSIRQKKIIRMKIDGFRQEDIAKRFNVTQATISRELKEVKKLILEY